MITDREFSNRIYRPKFGKNLELSPTHSFDLLEQLMPNELIRDQADLQKINEIAKKRPRKVRKCKELVSLVQSLFSSGKPELSVVNRDANLKIIGACYSERYDQIALLHSNSVVYQFDHNGRLKNKRMKRKQL